MDFVETMLTLIRSLNEAGVQYVLIGGAALNVHGLIRATEDVDLVIAPTAENVERLKRALHAVWDDPSIDEIDADELCGDYPALRYGPPDGPLYIDVMTRLGEVVKWTSLQSEEVVIDDVPIVVATPETLFRLKKDTVHPRDWADARALADAFGFEED